MAVAAEHQFTMCTPKDTFICRITGVDGVDDDFDRVGATTDYMKREQHRLDSFVHWPEGICLPEELARAGLFATQVGDRVQCPFCGGVIARWQPHDIPLVEHRKHFPSCSFVRGSEVGNIPIEPEVGSMCNHATYPADEPIAPVVPGLVRPAHFTNTLNRAEETEQFSTVVPVNEWFIENQTSSACHNSATPTDFTLELNRFATYTNWPTHLSQKPFILSQAGFYHCPNDEKPDRVKCAFCSGKLFHWLPNDDPFIEHATSFPTCPYIRRYLGGNVVSEMKTQQQAKIRNNNASSLIQETGVAYPQAAESSSDDNFDRRMLSEPVRAVLAMGFKDDLVARAVQTCLRERLGNFPPAEELAAIVIELEQSAEDSTAHA